MHQNFEDNLRILANFGKFSCKNSKIYGFRPYVFKKLQFSFFVFFDKDYNFLHQKSIHSAQKLRSNNFLQRKIQKLS